MQFSKDLLQAVTGRSNADITSTASPHPRHVSSGVLPDIHQAAT
jgi:hypothetical protein